MLTDEEIEHKPGLTPVQSWKEFFTRFSLPPFKLDQLWSRMLTNILKYHMNYMILSAFVIFIKAWFLSSYMIIFVPCIVICWWLLFFAFPGDYYSKKFNFRVRKNYIAIGLTIMLLWLSIVVSGNFTVAYAYSSISGLIVMLHSALKSTGMNRSDPIIASENTNRLDPESLRSTIHIDEDKRERQKMVRNRLREKYGLDK